MYKERGEISGAVNNTDYLYGLLFPGISDNIRIKIPEAIFSAEKFIVVVTDTRRSAKDLKALVEFRSKTLRSIRTVLGDVQQNLL
jgi:hypothetical protein